MSNLLASICGKRQRKSMSIYSSCRECSQFFPCHRVREQHVPVFNDRSHRRFIRLASPAYGSVGRFAGAVLLLIVVLLHTRLLLRKTPVDDGLVASHDLVNLVELLLVTSCSGTNILLLSLRLSSRELASLHTPRKSTPSRTSCERQPQSTPLLDSSPSVPLTSLQATRRDQS